MRIHECSLSDAPALAQMNRRLIEDEQSGNPMSITELQARMEGFLRDGYSAYFFVEEENVIGYALVKTAAQSFYLRQFFIERECRRRHYGKRAFHALLAHRHG